MAPTTHTTMTERARRVGALTIFPPVPPKRAAIDESLPEPALAAAKRAAVAAADRGVALVPPVRVVLPVQVWRH